MPSPFANMTLEKIRQKLNAAIDVRTLAVNRAFVEGDHWQNSEGWVGPRPDPGEDGYDDVIALLEKGFVSKNVIAEVCERHMSGIVGNEPGWAFVPNRRMAPDDEATPQEVAAIEEAEADLTWWFGERKLHRDFQEAIVVLLWASRSAFRLMIPPGLLDAVPVDPSLSNVETDDNGDPVDQRVGGASAGSLREALSLIYPERLEPEVSTVIVDDETKREAGILLYRNSEGQDTGELVYLDDLGNTVIRVISQGSIGPETPIRLGRRLTFHEMKRRLLITEQVQQQQRALNLAISCIPRTVITSGFLERVLLNAQMPGEWERDTDGNPVRFVPAKYVTGGGTTQFVQGIETGRDQQTGDVKVETPSVQWREPGQVLMPVSARDAHYNDILDECDQSHVLTNSAATPTGVSREQARADYEKSLQLTQPEAQTALGWLLETALAMAEEVMGQPGRYTNLIRVVVDLHLDTGPVTPDEQRVVAEGIAKNLMSEETGMSRLRIPDVDAEKARIMKQPGARLDLIKRQAEVIKTLTDAGFDLELAGQFVGFNEEQMALVKAFVVEQEQKQAELDAQAAEAAAAGNDQQPPSNASAAA